MLGLDQQHAYYFGNWLEMLIFKPHATPDVFWVLTNHSGESGTHLKFESTHLEQKILFGFVYEKQYEGSLCICIKRLTDLQIEFH